MMLPYAETSGLRCERSMRCATSSNDAWNVTTCCERPTRSVAIHLNWKLQGPVVREGLLMAQRSLAGNRSRWAQARSRCRAT